MTLIRISEIRDVTSGSCVGRILAVAARGWALAARPARPEQKAAVAVGGAGGGR
jgi:hypothetical protein